MSETELAQRFIASQAKIDGDDLRKGRVKQDRWPKVVSATEKLANAPLYLDDSSDMGILELRAKARRLHSRRELGLIFVDYLQLMRPEDSTDARVEQIGQISRGMKMLARELSVPVVALSQLSRAVESRPDKRPLLSDLRESGQHRAGRRPRDVHLPRRLLQQGVGAARRGGPDHRQAPKRPDRRRRADVHAALPEVLDALPRSGYGDGFGGGGAGARLQRRLAVARSTLD